MKKNAKKNKIKIKDLSQSVNINPVQKLEIIKQEEPNYIDDLSKSIDNKNRPHKKKKSKKTVKLSVKKISEITKEETELKNDKIDKKSLPEENINSNKNVSISNKDKCKNKIVTLEKTPKVKESIINDEKIQEKSISFIDSNLNENNDNKETKDKIGQKKKVITKKREKNNKKKSDELDEELEKEKTLNAIKKYNSLINSKILFDLKNILKTIFIFSKAHYIIKNSVRKISSIYRAFSLRSNFKFDFLLLKILNYRELCASKIISHYKGYKIRKLSKIILKKKEDYYIIYTTLTNHKMLYFKVKYLSGLEDNIYFEYCKLLNCFIYFISRKDKNISKKKLEGFFYNEKYNKLTDNMYKKNEKGENIINFPKILKKNDSNSEKYDKIINEYIKAHRPVKVKRMNVIEYEEKKKKAKDDMILNSKKNGEKMSKMYRSKSFMKLKGVMKNKGILKPSKSYINLRCDDKKIQFGQAKIKKYQNKKK